MTTATQRASRGLTLLRGGTFITYSTEKSDLEIISDGAMLFDDTILAISSTVNGLDSHLGTDGLQVVDTAGKIICPGFVDTHTHTWQTAMRTLAPNTQLLEYFSHYGPTGPASLILSPDDIYVSNLMGTLEGLNAGTTSTIDCAHMTWTREHASAALKSTIDSDARVWFAYQVLGRLVKDDPYTYDYSAVQDQMEHIKELAKESPFNGGLVSLSISYDGIVAGNPHVPAIFELARKSSLALLTTHDVGGVFGGGGNTIATLNSIPINPPALASSLPIVFSHCSNITPFESQLLRKYNKFASITPESEMHYGHGQKHSYLIQDQASLGTDTFFTYSIDMVTQMRIWLQSTRLQIYHAELDRWKIPSETPMTVNQAFLLGTRNGGLAVGRPDIGVLRKGAKADVLVFSTDSIGLVGWDDPVAAVVLHSNVRDIEQVYVDGKLVKTGGKLVYDWEAKGYGKRLKEIQQKFKEGLAKSNTTAIRDGLLPP